MFAFLTPLFLIGLASAAIPLVIHLSRSRRQKKMRFSTTRFFTDQFLRSYRMSRIKEVWLLALRMALFALFAMALARPLFLPPGQSFRFGQSRAVALVIDDSASMGYVEDGRTLLSQAQAAAGQVLDDLRAGTDSATIVLASRTHSGPEALFPEPTLELADVRAAVSGIQPRSLGTDLAGAVAKAEEVLARASARTREVYVLSDLQDSGWELERLPAAGEDQARTLYFLVGIRPKEPRNLAVTAVQYGAARPMAGIPFAFAAHVRNDSAATKACDVRLFVDGEKVGERRVEALAAGRWAVPRFHHVFARPGWHHGYVEAADASSTETGLPADDRRYFAFQVLGEVRVLAVNGAPSAVARLDELFFLRTALAASAGGDSAVRMESIEPAALAQADLAERQLVILANVESLSAPAVEKLEAYVDAGGSLLVFLGDKPTAGTYNALFSGAGRLHGGLLPARLAAIVGDAAAEEAVAFVGDSTGQIEQADDADLGNLAGVSFKALWRLEPQDGAAVLMRTNTGLPLAVEKPFGKGRTLIFASTADRDWTNFPARPAWLPWTFQLIGHLAQQPLSREGFYATGARAAVPVSAVEGLPQVVAKKPDGELAGAVSTDDPKSPLAIEDTSQAGVYELSIRPRGAPAASAEADALFVANLDNYESNLTYLDDVLAAGASDAERDAAVTAAAKEQLLAGRPLAAYVSSPDRLADASLSLRQGFPIWNFVLIVVLLIALVEPWLANRISQRHYARPVEMAPPAAIRTGRATYTPRVERPDDRELQGTPS